MKTIEEQAREYACGGIVPNSPQCNSCYNIHGKCNYEAFLAGARAATRWIPVEEELPKLIIHNDGGISLPPSYIRKVRMTITKADGIFFKNHRIGDVCEYIDYGCCPIDSLSDCIVQDTMCKLETTHWMPIPPASEK